MVAMKRSDCCFLLMLFVLIASTLCACGDTPEDDEAADATTSEQEPESPEEEDPPAPEGALAEHCVAEIGAPRVEEVADSLFVAIGYDLANTIVLQTDAGNVVIDVGSSPVRAQEMKDALMAVAPGPTLAIIYTHSHADHIGGASVWAEEDTQIWATDAFMPHLIKQYGAFRRAETARSLLQFGQSLSLEELPCSSLGKRLDVEAALETGVRAPTHTFSGEKMLEFGGVQIELVEAHGETHDHLFVHVPSLGALMPGDNYYATFPNLYTIRGTSPRPVDRWIDSLDAMRARAPDVLVPSHTSPVQGADAVQAVLIDYRDAIQWVRDEVVRWANAVEDVDSLAGRIALPAHLADQSYLQQLYGQVDWSARAIYSNQLGWFDGRADRLYPPDETARREIELMGGAPAVLAAATAARKDGDARWAAHLLGKLRDSGLAEAAALEPELAAAYEAIGLGVQNSNGRAYLVESARALTQGPPTGGAPKIDDVFIDAIPVKVFFEALPSRLKTAESMDVFESAVFEFTDTSETFVVTVRHGVAEVVAGEALPGTPEPITTVTTDTGTWRRLALGLKDQLEAVTEGKLTATDLIAVVAFMDRFDRGL